MPVTENETNNAILQYKTCCQTFPLQFQRQMIKQSQQEQCWQDGTILISIMLQ